MPVEFLSDEQVDRFGRFAADPSPVELERCFRLDAEATRLVAGKRRDENRLGFAVQWGTVRALGTFLGEDPTAVPAGVAAFVADQLEIPNPACLEAYAARPQTAYEHQWEIRRECGYREFASGEAELRMFVAARVWALEEGPRALFDRAVLWLIEHRVLLPGITVLARLVADVGAAEHDRFHRMLAEAPSTQQLQRFERLLVVSEGARRSRLDQLRGGNVNLSGRGFQAALEQARELLSNCYRYELRSKRATIGAFVEWENLFGYKIAKAWSSASGQTATLLVWEPGSSESSSLFQGPEILSVMDLGLEGDLSFEAAQLMLNDCTRSTCQDSAFGDAEVFWDTKAGELIATGYFGSTQDVTIWPEAFWRLVRFEGKEAQILRDCGAEGRTDENASSFRDDHEEDEDDENVVDADE